MLFGALPCGLTYGIRRFVESSPEMFDGILSPEAHTQWRLVALVTLFAAFVCYRPPKTFVASFARLEVPDEWRGQMAVQYQTLVYGICMLSFGFHLSAGDTRAASQALLPACVFLDNWMASCTLQAFQRRRRLWMCIMGPIHIATIPLRASRPMSGAAWPATMLFPVTGALLHDSVTTHLAEALFMNALIFVDTSMSSNALRIAASISTLFSLVVLLVKILMFSRLPCHIRLDDDATQLTAKASCGETCDIEQSAQLMTLDPHVSCWHTPCTKPLHSHRIN